MSQHSQFICVYSMVDIYCACNVVKFTHIIFHILDKTKYMKATCNYMYIYYVTKMS